MSSVPPPGRPPSRWAPLIVALLAVAVYAGTLRNGIVRDDYFIVQTNPLVTGEASPWLILASHYWAGVREQGDLYRPLTVATYWLNARVAGKEAWSFHLVNILLHGAVSALVVSLGRRWTGSAAAALVGGVLFAVHPVLSEAVASIVGRADLLAALFVVAAWTWRERHRTALILFSCGLLCKENAVVLPGLLLAEDLMGRRARAGVREYLSYAAVVGAFLGVRAAVLGGLHAGALSSYFTGVPASHRILTGVEVVARYVALLFFPVNLSADYSYDQIPIVTSALAPGFLAGIIAIAAAAALAVRSWKGVPGVSLGILTFAIALLPVSNIPFGIGEMMAERFLYLPAAGFCLAAGAAMEWLLVTLGARRVTLAAGLAAIVPASLFAARTWVRVGDWADPLAFCEASSRSAPRSAKVHGNCGLVYQSLHRRDEAEGAYRRALAIDPEDSGTHFGLGTLYEEEERISEAVVEYDLAVSLRPDDPQALNNLGRALLALRRPREAIEVLERAVAANPASSTPAVNLAAAWLAAGDPGRAERILRKVLAAVPGDPAARRVMEAVERRKSGNGPT